MFFSSHTWRRADFGIDFLSSLFLHKKQHFWVDDTDLILERRLWEVVEAWERVLEFWESAVEAMEKVWDWLMEKTCELLFENTEELSGWDESYKSYNKDLKDMKNKWKLQSQFLLEIGEQLS